MTKKINCWEFKKCGREEGGAKTAELGVCPASTHETSTGLNNGKCAGRICWAIAGTLCGGQVQGSFVNKQKNCADCDFFILVEKEEGSQLFSIKPKK